VSPPEPVDRATLAPDLRALLDELGSRIAASPLLATLGGTVLDWGPGWAEVAVPTTSASANIAGTVHGAILTAAADCAFETACNSYGRICVAVSLSAQFTGPAAVGTELRAVAREVNRSRSLASYRVDVTDGSGRLVVVPGPGPPVTRLAPRVATVARRMARSLLTAPAHGVALLPSSMTTGSTRG
jgi:acyl-CoA thioesterase